MYLFSLLDCRPILSIFQWLSQPMARVFAYQPGEWGYTGGILNLWPDPRFLEGPNSGFITVYFSNSGKNKHHIILPLWIKSEVLQEKK